jgi:hypothetical protein
MAVVPANLQAQQYPASILPSGNFVRQVFAISKSAPVVLVRSVSVKYVPLRLVQCTSQFPILVSVILAPSIYFLSRVDGLLPLG